MNNAAIVHSGAGYGSVNSYRWWCFTRAALENKKASRMHVRGEGKDHADRQARTRKHCPPGGFAVRTLEARVCDILDRRWISLFEMR